MARELFRRQQSALLLVFKPSADGSYDLANVADAELKCIATEDINAARFAQLVAGFAKRFAPRKKGQPGVPGTVEEQLYEFKGDRLGISFDEFKQKYARNGRRRPAKAAAVFRHGVGAEQGGAYAREPWHQQAGIIHARVDLPAEDNSPTVAGVKTELLSIPIRRRPAVRHPG